MKKLIIVSILLVLAACSNSGTKTEAKTSAVSNVVKQQPARIAASYEPRQTMQLISSKKDLLIVDVRSPQELREGKIKNSVLVPFWNIMKGNYNIPKDRPVLLVCAVGGRSYAAMQILAKQGYPELYSLKGGINAWKNAKMPVEF